MEEIKQDLLNVNEVRKILRIPLSTLYYLTKIGAIKSLRIGKHIRYRKTDIEYYLENGFGKQCLPERDNTKEKRLYPRINCDINCRFKINLLDKKSNVLDSVIRNISAGGFFMSDPRVCHVRNDDPVEVEFNLAQKDFFVSGRVVRTQDNGFAVKYRNIPSDIKEEIIRYVG